DQDARSASTYTIAGDDVSVRGVRTADRVVTGLESDIHTAGVVRYLDRAGHIGPDLVVGNGRELRSKVLAAENNPKAEIARDRIARDLVELRIPAGRVTCGTNVDPIEQVAQQVGILPGCHNAGRVGSDLVILNDRIRGDVANLMNSVLSVGADGVAADGV